MLLNIPTSIRPDKGVRLESICMNSTEHLVRQIKNQSGFAVPLAYHHRIFGSRQSCLITKLCLWENDLYP